MRDAAARHTIAIVMVWCAVVAVSAIAQDTAGKLAGTTATAGEQDPSVAAEQGESDRPPRVWNGFETRWVSGRGIGALGLDFFRYGQDDVGREQVGDLVDFEKPVVRVVRALAVGTINFERAWTWIVAGVYGGFVGGFDREEDPAWSLIDLALEIPVPKVGHVLIGKAKEPLSMERLMGGGLMPFMERSMGAEALTASRSVGIRVYNSFADNRLTWAGGIYKTRLFADVPLGTPSRQFVGRLTGLPLDQPDGSGLLHLALGARYSNVNAGSLRFRGVPEAGNLPLYVDTDVFDADRMTNTNVEIYYQKGPLWVANEYLSTWTRALATDNPRFQAFFSQVAWTLTGEAMPYDRQRAVFLPMTPATPAPDGGTGLVQLAVRYSMVDLQDRGVMGGRMSRLSGGINWYPTGKAIVNFHYGRARLERGGKTGTTHIFQMRLFFLM